MAETLAGGMADRVRLMTIVFNTLVVATLVLNCAGVSCLFIAPGGDYFDGRIDIPVELTPIWPGAQTGLGVHDGGVAMLSTLWRPTQAFMGTTVWLALVTIAAAAARNVGLYFACQLLLAIPGELFGFHDPFVNTGVVVVGAIIMLVHGLFRKNYRHMAAVVVVAVAIWAIHVAADGRNRPGDPHSNMVFDEVNDGFDHDEEAVTDIQSAMASASSVQRPAAAYALAQLAYIRRDWAAVKRLAPHLQPDRFTHGAYTANRIYILKAYASGDTHVFSFAAARVIVLAFGASTLLMVISGGLLWRMRGRSSWLDKMSVELARLRQAAA